ncbi:MAG: hypothetical protein AAFW89_06510 [Bacteroidota bacterium]
MNISHFIFILILILCSFGCASKNKTQGPISIQMSPEQKQELIRQLNSMADMDERYRRAISLGTLDSSKLAQYRELAEAGDVDAYLAFKRSTEQTLSDPQIDSLWALQHALDYQNYGDLKRIIHQYGYPSEERLEHSTDLLYPLLLHPPIELDPEAYLDEMSDLLKPEVLAGRMSAKKYAMFVDNIRIKVLNKPQLYGTNQVFNPETMQMGPPVIEDLELSNKLRKELGLPGLKTGEYEVLKKEG